MGQNKKDGYIFPAGVGYPDLKDKKSKKKASEAEVITKAVDYLEIAMRYGFNSEKELEEILSKEFKKNNNGTHVKNYMGKAFLNATCNAYPDKTPYKIVLEWLPTFKKILYGQEFTSKDINWDASKIIKKNYHDEVNKCLMKMNRIDDKKFKKWSDAASDDAFIKYIFSVLSPNNKKDKPKVKTYKRKLLNSLND